METWDENFDGGRLPDEQAKDDILRAIEFPEFDNELLKVPNLPSYLRPCSGQANIVLATGIGEKGAQRGAFFRLNIGEVRIGSIR